MAMRTTVHNNAHQLCTIGMLTTGDDPETEDIIQLTILPINSEYQPYNQFNPFNMEFKPARRLFYTGSPGSETTKYATKVQYSSAMIKGIDPIDAIELLQLWVKNLKLPYNKKIMPMAGDWPRLYSFLVKWLGIEDYQLIFDWRCRDLTSISNYANDKADINCVPMIYQKHYLKWKASQLKIPFINDGDSLEEAIAVAETYRRMLKEMY